MAQSSTHNIRQAGGGSNLGAASAALWDCRQEIQKRQRDRTGEVIDDAPAIHGDHPPAIDRTAVVRDWSCIWGRVLESLTPAQLKGLDIARDALRQGRRDGQ